MEARPPVDPGLSYESEANARRDRFVEIRMGRSTVARTWERCHWRARSHPARVVSDSSRAVRCWARCCAARRWPRSGCTNCRPAGPVVRCAVLGGLRAGGRCSRCSCSPAAPTEALAADRWRDHRTDVGRRVGLPAGASGPIRRHPGAAASLREGTEQTLTVIRLGVTGKLQRTLQSTNPCESMISTVRAINRNVKNWSSGEMCLRWTAAGMLEAETRFRKVEGYRGLAQPRRRDRTRAHQPPQQGTRHNAQCVTINPGPPSPEVPRRAGVRPDCWRSMSRRHRDSATSSSSPAGEGPVRVAARRPGSRLPASGGNVRGWSAASSILWGVCDRAVRSVKRSLPRRERVSGRAEPRPVW